MLSFLLANIRAPILLPAAVLVIAAVLPLQGENKSYLPVLQTTDADDLGIALVNPTITDTTVTLTARSYSGAAIQKDNVTNPIMLTLPASSQKALLTADIFGNGISGQTGWVELSASSPAVKGCFMIFDSGLNYIDGSEISSKVSRRLIFPKVSSSSPTRLAIVNTAPDAVQGATSVYENSGRLVGTGVLTLPAFGGFTGTVNELVPSSSGFEGYMVVESQTMTGSEGPESLVGFETYRNRSDIALIRAFPEAARLQTGYLAHLASGAGYSTTLTLLNDRGYSQAVRITAQLDGGQPYGPMSVSVERIIPPNGRLYEPIDQMFGLLGNSLTTGYIRYESPGDTPGVFGYLDYGTTDGIVLSAVEAQGEGYSDIFFSHLAEGFPYYTGVALLNSNAQPAIVTLDMFDQTGGHTGSTVFTLRAGERKARLVDEFLQRVVNQLGGYIRITSSRPIFAIELIGSRTLSGFLADVSVQGVNLIPRASGFIVSASAGADVISEDGAASILIPPNALTVDTPIRVVRIGIADVQRPPVNQRLVSIVETAPDGMPFQIPVRLTLGLDVQLPPGTRIPLLAFNRRTGQYQTTKFFATADESGRIASAEVTYLTMFVAALPYNQPVIVMNLEPSGGYPGVVVAITGDGFSTNAGENVVTFAGANNTTVPAQVLAATPKSITVVVPAGAVTGPVVVRVGSKSSIGMTFTVLAEPVVNPPPPNPLPPSPTPSNMPPVVNAGLNQTIALPAVATLSGTATDDGLPVGSTLMVTWTKASGSGTVTFANAHALSTTATFSSAGTYVLRLTASDTALSSTSDVTIVVNAATGTLPGLTDSATHMPPTSGTYAYDTFKPSTAGFPSRGQTYVDPVFGSRIRRLTNDYPAQNNDDIYGKNGWWNAKGTLFMHRTLNDRTFIDTTTGAVVRTGVPAGVWGGDASFDPVDPDAWYYAIGSSLMKYSALTGASTLLKTFPAAIEELGGSNNWIDRTGRYFLVAYGGIGHIWDKQSDAIYAGGVSYGTNVGGGVWLSITPSGKYLVDSVDINGVTHHRSYPLDHNTKTVSGTGTDFWTLCGSHGDLVSPSDGKDYYVSYDCDYTSAIYRVDITIPQTAGDYNKQLNDNVKLVGVDWQDIDTHYSCVPKAPNSDWCFVDTEAHDDTFSSRGPWRPYKQEIIMVQVVAPYTVRRLAHHRSRNIVCNGCAYRGYYYQPRINASWDGTKVAWASNMGYDAGSTEYADIYTLDMPALLASDSAAAPPYLFAKLETEDNNVRRSSIMSSSRTSYQKEPSPNWFSRICLPRQSPVKETGGGSITWRSC